jgi:hypothetical protein
MPVILAAQETGIKRITVQRQPRQIFPQTLSQKYPTQKRTGRVAQTVEQVPKKYEVLQYHKEAKKKNRK